MANPLLPLARFYDRLMLKRPAVVILCLLVAFAFLGYKARNFRLDASAETLLLKTDKDLQYSRMIKKRYGGYDYLLVTYAPKGDLFSDKTLANLARLRDELKQIPNVSSVVSILDAPLLESPPVPAKELATHIRTLQSPDVDRKLARIEFKNSPIYKNLLVSPDLTVTALQINLQPDRTYEQVKARLVQLQDKKTAGQLSAAEIAEYHKVSARLAHLKEARKENRHETIVKIRATMDRHRGEAKLFLGGITMVANDMIRFIKNDLKIFGIGILFFLVVTLRVIFKNKRWVLLPMFCCAFSAISMMGLLAMFDWPVTVISSNFISLQLIITMAVTIHLIVRYRDLSMNNPGADRRQLILDTVHQMATPCLYAALTTIAGFGSLLLCDIQPVKAFGWMMIAGIVVSLAVTFLLFPAWLMLLKKKTPPLRRKSHYSLTSFLAHITEAHGTAIVAISAIVFILSIIGICRLVIENSFIDYFKDTTEIHRGMKVIDQKLGGTTPLDVIVEMAAPEPVATRAVATTKEKSGDEFDEFDKTDDTDKYWFAAHKMQQVEKIHDYLDGLPATGKVMSLATLLKIAEKLNHNQPLNNFQLALLYSELPPRFKDMLLKPYVSVANNQLRYSIRIKDSEKSLKRNRLLKKIQHDLITDFGLKKEHVHLAGLMVLYNNMLQSLFESQILTLGFAVLVLMGMFLVLFKSLKLSLIAIVPNLLAIGTVLGFMGWMKIPLDMMTITIAAISLGIAVDNTIHYIYRFKHEFAVDPNYIHTVQRCHGSIGYALYYTSLTVITGFSILALSNFIPTIYFGLLTGLAMFMALIAALTLLPQLLIIFKPFGPEGNQEG